MAVSRVALACGAALVMVTAALGGLHNSEESAPVVTVSPPPAAAPADTELPSASELDLGDLPEPWSTR